MCDSLDILKPHFFPHYACFQYGVGGYELWLAKRCVQYVVATDIQDDYEWLLEAKDWLDLPSLTLLLTPLLMPNDYAGCIMQFKPGYFHLIYVYMEPANLDALFPEVLACLKPNGILVLPTRQRHEIMLDYEEIGEGVYRKPCQ